MGNVIRKFKGHINNLPGYRTNRKILVFESDDWGMVRTSSVEAINNLGVKYPLTDDYYSTNDALERDVDIAGLLEVLENNTSKEGNQPKFTFNMVMFNPAFEQIESSGFSQYFRQSFVDSYSTYDGLSGAFMTLQNGIENGYLTPQYHATEHININNWMSALQQNDSAARKAFQFGMANILSTQPSNCHKEYLDAWGYTSSYKFEEREYTVSVGLQAFSGIFGRPSLTAIAPCYIWDSAFESIALAHGIRFFQGSTVQRIPNQNGVNYKRHFMGDRGALGQRYLIRNCELEHSNSAGIDLVDRCLWQIKTAFLYRKPAIVSTHRVNYIGRLNESNRDAGLNNLDRLLKEINKHWPDVTFMSSEELAKEMEKQKA